MIIKALGTSSSLPSANRNYSGILVNNSVLLDIGEGTARQMVKFKVNPSDIKAGVITHAHIDHSAGIFSLLFWMKLSDRTNEFTLFMPEYMIQPFENFLPVLRIRDKTLPFVLNIKPVNQGIFYTSEDLSLYAVGNNHLNPYRENHDDFVKGSYSFSIIVKDGKSKIIYTSDIQSMDHLKNHSGSCDLLLSEAAHVSADSVYEFARKNEIKKIALTHIPPDFNEKDIHWLDNKNYLVLNDGDTLRI